MKRSKGHVRFSWQRIALSTLCVFLALVLLVMLVATVFLQDMLSYITHNEDDPMHATLSSEQAATATEATDPYETEFTGPSIHPTDVTVNTIPSIPKEDLIVDGIVNILLIGEDRRPGEGRQRSDSMILCSFDTNKNTITMISFLRDTYIPTIPGYWADKINAAYAFGGARTLNQTLAAYFGVHVDANVAVQFDGFEEIIDLLGGVDIELTSKEANYLNTSDLFGWHGWNLKAGMQHLDGAQALAYSRIRKIDMDAMRAQRQRKVLTALINAYKSKSLDEMITLTYEILKTRTLTTDMTTSEIINYVTLLFPMLSTATINSQQIPAEGTYESVTVGSVKSTKVCDFEVNRKILQKIFT